MKKNITSFLISFGLSISFLLAQSNSDLSENKPTSTGKGYAFEFNTPSSHLGKGEDINCLKYHSDLFTNSVSSSIDEENGYLVFDIDGSVDTDNGFHRFNFVTNNCEDYEYKMGTNQLDSTICVRVKSDFMMPTFIVQFIGTIGDSIVSGQQREDPFNYISPNEWHTLTFFGEISLFNGTLFDKFIGIRIQVTDTHRKYLKGKVLIDYVRIGDAIQEDKIVGNQEQIENDFFVYPNPTTNNINIESNGLNNYSVIIYNLLGEQIINENYDNNSSLNVSALKKGIYILKIVSEERLVKTEKIIIE